MKAFTTACISVAGSVLAVSSSTPAETRMVQLETMPFAVAPGLFDQSQPNTLGLDKIPGAEIFTIFTPDKSKRGEPDARCSELPYCPGFNHCVSITPIEKNGKDYLRAEWQACEWGEDSADGIKVYSLSEDNGATWSKPQKIGRPNVMKAPTKTAATATPRSPSSATTCTSATPRTKKMSN